MRYLQFDVTMYDTARATPGFTLIVPMFRHEAYLIGMRGEVLHLIPVCVTTGEPIRGCAQERANWFERRKPAVSCGPSLGHVRA